MHKIKNHTHLKKALNLELNVETNAIILTFSFSKRRKQKKKRRFCGLLKQFLFVHYGLLVQKWGF